MKTKILEIRDRNTYFLLFCVDMNSDSPLTHKLLRSLGYPCDGHPNIAISHASANGLPFSNDPYYWAGRTYPVAHNFITDHWNELSDGDVIDVEYILGESKVKKIPQREEHLGREAHDPS